MRHLTTFVLAAASLLGIESAGAQQMLRDPVGRIVSYQAASGSFDNATGAPVVVAAMPIQVDGSGWIRVYFSELSLPSGSFVRVTSMLDGQVQELDAAAAEMWSNSTAYLNGDVVLLELIAGAHSKGTSFSVGSLGLNDGMRPAGGAGECGICGSDTRNRTSEAWAGRIVPAGCSASVYCETGVGMVTAGHCLHGFGAQVVQFNVPSSTAECTIVAPPVEDQFPVVATRYTDGGPGNDWGVLTVGTNTLGETPFERYGLYRPLANTAGAAGNSVNLWGYGADLTCANTNTQQRSTGTIGTVAASSYTSNADVRSGNSGSGLLNSTHQIIGIVTHCGYDCDNVATRIDLPAFVSAIAELAPCEGATGDNNDACLRAIVVGAGNFEGSTLTATNDGTAACGSSNTSRDVWYSFTPTCSGTYRIDTCGSNFDTALSLHLGCGLSSWRCNDDHAVSNCGESVSSAIVTTLSAGTTYLIRIAGYQNAAGAFSLNIASTGFSTPNDACASALTLGLNAPVIGDTRCATNDGSASCGNSATSRDLWYAYSPSVTGTYTLSTEGSALDAVVSVHSACPAHVGNQVGCDDNGGLGTASQLSVSLAAGTTYRIRVAGANGAAGEFSLVLTDGTSGGSCPGGSCPGDFDGDSDFDSDDLLAFFSAWDGGESCADTDGDEDADSDDIVIFFTMWDAGEC